MNISPKNFVRIYLTLFTLSIYTYRFGEVLDRATVQYLTVSIVNFLTIISIPLFFKNLNLKKLIKDPLLISYFGYLLMAILSLLVALNKVESLVRINQLFTFLLSLGIFMFFLQRNLIQLKDILWLSAITLVIDMSFSLEQYVFMVLNEIPYKYDYINNLVGLSGNRNILATVILFRIPLLIILAKELNKNIFYFISFLIGSTAFFNIILLSSRAAFLSIGVCVIFLVMMSSYRYFYVRKNILRQNMHIILLFIVPFFIAFQVSNYVIDTNDDSYFTNRVQTIVGPDDESKNTRIRYYSQAISHIVKNPLLGGGIGNWKIYSIGYDSKNIQNYIVPYNAHNDVLEATAETGILGGVFFLSFFILIFLKLSHFFKKIIDPDNDYQFYSLLFLPYIIYFIDLNLNFPSHRPMNLYLLLLFICIIYLKSPKLIIETK